MSRDNGFSLRSCRSSSVNFFDFSQGNLENLAGNLEGIFRGFFLTHRTKAQKFRGEFRSIFCTKIRGSKKIFCAKFTLQTCHLNNGETIFAARHQGVSQGPLGRGARANSSPALGVAKTGFVVGIPQCLVILIAWYNCQSENSRRLWLSEIRCWKSFPPNFNAVGK